MGERRAPGVQHGRDTDPCAEALGVSGDGSGSAIKITGSPFRTFTDAEEACNAMLRHLKQKDSDQETWH